MQSTIYTITPDACPNYCRVVVQNTPIATKQDEIVLLDLSFTTLPARLYNYF
jgi:hypothetical protein